MTTVSSADTEHTPLPQLPLDCTEQRLVDTVHGISEEQLNVKAVAEFIAHRLHVDDTNVVHNGRAFSAKADSKGTDREDEQEQKMDTNTSTAPTAAPPAPPTKAAAQDCDSDTSNTEYTYIPADLTTIPPTYSVRIAPDGTRTMLIPPHIVEAGWHPPMAAPWQPPQAPYRRAPFTTVQDLPSSQLQVWNTLGGNMDPYTWSSSDDDSDEPKEGWNKNGRVFFASGHPQNNDEKKDEEEMEKIDTSTAVHAPTRPSTMNITSGSMVLEVDISNVTPDVARTLLVGAQRRGLLTNAPPTASPQPALPTTETAAAFEQIPLPAAENTWVEVGKKGKTQAVETDTVTE
jgi:hypothetical protein